MTHLRTRAAAFLSILIVLAPLPVSNLHAQSSPGREDPAVEAYTTFVKGMKLTATVPVDSGFVVAALDRLVTAVEGLAIGRDVATDALLARGHEIRRDLRRLAGNDRTSLEILKKKTDVFLAISELVSTLNVALRSRGGAEQWGIDALKRSADGLDFEYPLKWQPGAIQGFLDIAAQVLNQMATR